MTTNVTSTSRLLTIPEVADRLRQSRWTVYKKITSGEIPAVRLGSNNEGPLRVDERELEHYIYGDGDAE